MKKIGIVSINKYVGEPNYGSALQTFALYSAVGKLGYKVEVIDYSPRYSKNSNTKWGLPPWRNVWGMMNYILNLPSRLRKWRDYVEFFSRKMVWSLRVDWEQFNLDEYALYIVGSDTVWNIRQTRGFEPGFFAMFPCMTQVIAYAPSFGDAKYSAEEAECFQRSIRHFAALSVREPVNKNAFGALLPKVKTVLDPTLLYSATWYDGVLQAPKFRDKYLFLYQLYYDDPAMIAKVDKFAREKGLRIIDASKFRHRSHPRALRCLLRMLAALGIKKGACLMPEKDAVPHDMRLGLTIGEWLGLIRNAEYVVTNSFHGTIFSILFKRKFTCFSRPDATSKMQSLCHMLGLENRFITIPKDIIDTPIDYDGVIHPKLEELRAESWGYLKSSIEKVLESK